MEASLSERGLHRPEVGPRIALPNDTRVPQPEGRLRYVGAPWIVNQRKNGREESGMIWPALHDVYSKHVSTTSHT